MTDKPEGYTFGRPTKYKPEYCQAIVDFFDKSPYKEDDEGKLSPNDLPTIEKFCHTIDITKKTLHEWTTKHADFLNAYERSRELQKEIWIQNSLRGHYNSNFTKFLGQNVFGWTDKQQIEHGNIDDKEIKVSLIDTEAPDNKE